MSDLNLVVGQTATGKLTFDEPTPPSDGAVASDRTDLATIDLAADHVTWTVHAVGADPSGPAVATFTYTGTSAAPDVGPAVVLPMTATVSAVPVAEHGDFNPAGATISGP